MQLLAYRFIERFVLSGPRTRLHLLALLLLFALVNAALLGVFAGALYFIFHSL